MTAPIRVAIAGALGRMGTMLVRAVAVDPALKLVGGTERPQAVERASGGVHVVDDLAVLLGSTDVVIDFTTADASVEHAKACAAKGVALVIGSTGFTPEAKAELARHASKIPVVLSPNMSIGVNLMIEMAAEMARRLGEDFEVDILEAHHRMKKDAPSGTALRLAEEIARATGRSEKNFKPSRVGQIGERPKQEIGIATLRGGDVVGEHTVYFFGEGERLELTHRATNREGFVRGALRAAKWVVGKPPGIYGMERVLKG